VVANHDGQVRVWSQPGKGSTFTMKLRTVSPDGRGQEAEKPTVVESTKEATPKPRSSEFIATGHGLDQSVTSRESR